MHIFSRRPVLLSTGTAAALLLTLLVPLVVRAQDNAAANSPVHPPLPSHVKVYDLKSEALLQRAADRMKAAQYFSAQIEFTSQRLASGKLPVTESRSVSTFRVQRPNLVYNEIRIEKQGRDGKRVVTPTAKYLSDGKKGVRFSLSDKTYSTLPVTMAAMANDYGISLPEFFVPAVSDAQMIRGAKASGWLVSLVMAPDTVFGGVACSVVEEKTLLDKTPKARLAYRITKIYVSKKDGLIRGYHTETPVQSSDGNVDNSVENTDTIITKVVITNVVVGDKRPDSVFAVNLSGYKKYVKPKDPELLTAGTLAPDFTVYDRDNKPIKLSDYKGKVVVLDFWATWCGPCMVSLPHTTDVARKTADKGVVVLAVNVWDKKEEFDKWLPAHPQYALLTFAIDKTEGQGQDVATKLYRVTGIPTQYVVDRNGRIVTAFVGFDGPTDALEKAIIKADEAMPEK